MNKIKVIALFAPAGAGKDYLLKKVLYGEFFNKPKNLHEIISQTTRPPREGEKDGVNYYFKTDKQFLKDIEENNLLEWTSFRDWYYGTNLSALNKNKINIGVFNIQGIQALLENPQLEVYPVAVKASAKTRLIRQLTREENPNIREIFRRYDADERDFSFVDFHYFVINNEDYDEAHIDLANFINSL